MSSAKPARNQAPNILNDNRLLSLAELFPVKEARTVVNQTGNVWDYPVRAYLVHMNVVVVVTVINGFDEAFELAHSAAVDHQNESHSDWVLYTGQAVVELSDSLDLI